MTQMNKSWRAFYTKCITLLILIVFLSTTESNGYAHGSKPQVGLRLYYQSVSKAAQELIDATPEEQRGQLLYSFEDEQRIYGPDRTNTDSFCGVLAWCAPWGVKQGEMNQAQLVALNKLLSLSLSSGGYQNFVAGMNIHRIIGEIEDVASPQFMQEATELCPDVEAEDIFELREKCPAATFNEYNTVAGALSPVNGEYDMTWIWRQAPGLSVRQQQFENFSISFFGELGSENWSFRFEGHHQTLSIHIHKDPKTGQLTVHNTPLFLGAFPVIIPEDPYEEDFSSQWNWAKGQMLMYNVVDNIREFWLEIPEPLKAQAYISNDNFKQAAPLLVDTFVPWLLSAIEPSVDVDAIDSYPHISIRVRELPPEAIWRLKQVFMHYLGTMSIAVAEQYQSRLLKALLKNEVVTLAWSGSALEDKGGRHFSYIRVGDLLLEFQQSNQWSTQHDPNMRGNHVHSMLRDLSYDWTNPMSSHIHSHHAGHSHH